jgi:hypothetical protein
LLLLDNAQHVRLASATLVAMTTLRASGGVGSKTRDCTSEGSAELCRTVVALVPSGVENSQRDVDVLCGTRMDDIRFVCLYSMQFVQVLNCLRKLNRLATGWVVHGDDAIRGPRVEEVSARV